MYILKLGDDFFTDIFAQIAARGGKHLRHECRGLSRFELIDLFKGRYDSEFLEVALDLSTAKGWVIAHSPNAVFELYAIT